MKNFKLILAIAILAAISYSCNNSAVQKMMQEPETGIIVSDENKAKSQVEDMCKKLLANLVIEDYKII